MEHGTKDAEKEMSLVAWRATKIKIFSTQCKSEQTVSGIFILYRNTNKLIFMKNQSRWVLDYICKIN